MFTNLDFLQVGKKWAPTNSVFQKRQENYITGRLAYEGDIESVYKDVWGSIATRYGKTWGEMQQVMIKVNFFKALTDTFEFLAFRKEPEIWVGEGKSAKRLEDLELMLKTNLLNLMIQGFISGHAQGDGVIKVYSKTDNEPDIAIVNPENWIPVQNPQNLKETMCHVVAQTYEVDNSTTVLGHYIEKTKTYLDAEVHYKGYYDKFVFELDKNNIIQKVVDKKENIKTGFDDFLVFPFNYGTPSWREWGKSAYHDIIPLVDEIIVRLSNNSKILDDHAEPQLLTPRESLEFDNKTGEYYYDRKKALAIGKDGQKPEYLTWDGQLDSAEKQLDRIMAMFYMLSGTNPQLFGQDIAGNLSGEALAKIFLIAISKTQKMILRLEDAFERALNCYLKIKGINETVNIKFDIGQFNTQADISERIVQEKNAGITSTRRAVEEINPRYTQEEVEQELLLIQEDKKSESMTSLEDIFPQDDNLEDE